MLKGVDVTSVARQPGCRDAHVLARSVLLNYTSPPYTFHFVFHPEWAALEEGWSVPRQEAYLRELRSNSATAGLWDFYMETHIMIDVSSIDEYYTMAHTTK